MHEQTVVNTSKQWQTVKGEETEVNIGKQVYTYVNTSKHGYT